ncbi:ABC transporter permease [Bifidobacterium subtile]|jgi:putative spermidine/putrescine transport system permease protein|uniref:ABC transporter permease n=1 Tax=Bifidobacterium subtile TaxID=77635 RepID=A0A087E3V8_9BIFI|nr:ABC transporter permease subunit [Bifidobacterium subtile]KFJ02459.1 ABC transporter permease [Bifidobacterium subtile]MCI1222753.1 ABC transporter permease subunit [Bifidobacterium subtile]MCI1240684.1 ABC transporter permease subunit [Bifidobacterium subtile]MCI1257725.1 ABC transporter permease subunit [Bifidobacterium subtile]QOL35902.1 ABC transporter permease subunit [Bifidobacterium subtile]
MAQLATEPDLNKQTADSQPTRDAVIWKRYDRPSKATKAVVLTLFLLFLAFPVVGMIYFTFRSSAGGFTLSHWADLVSGETSSLTSMQDGLMNSIVLVIVTIAIEYVIVIPALVLINVRFPRLDRAMRIIMLLPIALPAIILVVGFAPIFSFLSTVFEAGTWTLSLAYGIIALPFVYTTIESDLVGMNAATLTQAAESLGAGWWRVLLSILIPCLRKSIISSTLITAAIVLGEFTIASLLNRETLQTDLIVVSQSDVYFSVIITLIVLAVTFLALFAVSGLGNKRRKS